MQSPFDRGFDEVQPRRSEHVHPVIDRNLSSKGAKRVNVKMFLAIAMVGVLSITAFMALTLPAKSDDAGPVRSLAGEREIDYTIDNMFWVYKKSMDYADHGRWNYSDPGLTSYWGMRTAYQEYVVRNTFPFIYVYNPYSTRTVPDVNAGFVTTTWYRMYIDAKNITEIGTGPGEDPIFLPVRGAPALPGGWVNISWYSTYLTTQEMGDIRTAGTHYANTYYGVPTRATPGPASDDGYWHELQGILEFDRGAAEKILGINGADLRDAFTADQGAIEADWFDKWMIEGGTNYDIYTMYDFSDDIRYLGLLLDDSSTADNLVLRFWSMSWGNEGLLVRYMEAAGVWKYMEAWPDDWYLNITIGPTQGDVFSRSVNGYHMTAWKDANNFIGGWNLETVHIDWCNNDAPLHLGYPSPYAPYDPETTNVKKVSWLPGTTQYGNEVSYWLPPQEWDFVLGETMTIVLPAADVPILGIVPYRGAADSPIPEQIPGMISNMYWGELTMGNGYPADLDQYYDAGTRTVSIVGPVDFAPLINSYGVMETGAPTFMFDVSPVSYYDVAISGSAPYYAGTDYTLTVTAKNQTGVTVPYNGTVTLTSTDTNILLGGAAQPATHAYVPGDAGVWTVTLQFGTLGMQDVTATDLWLPDDVTGVLTVDVTDWIPEFPTMLIPVIGAVAMFVFLGKRARKKEA